MINVSVFLMNLAIIYLYSTSPQNLASKGFLPFHLIRLKIVLENPGKKSPRITKALKEA